MSAAATIVVVEDDPDIADLLDLYLRRDGYEVFLAATGERGLEVIAQRRPDLVILDVGLPGDVDGLQICKQLADTPTAVVMLTARDAEIDRVLGLEMGADDYVTKPFSPREMVARVKAVLRRSGQLAKESAPTELRIGAVRCELGPRRVSVGDAQIALAAREFDLLAYLFENPGLVLSRQQLLDAVWGPDWYGDERTVDVHVRQLRKKLGPDLALTTVWGVGYRLDGAPA